MVLKDETALMYKARGLMKKSIDNLENARELKDEKKIKKAEINYMKNIYFSAMFLSFQSLKVAILYDVLGKTFQECAELTGLNDRSNAYYHYGMFKDFLNPQLDEEDMLTKVYLARRASTKTFKEFQDQLDVIIGELAKI